MKSPKSQLEAWLSRLDRRPPAFPAALGVLGGFSAAMALTADSVPKAAGLTAVAALGFAAGGLALGGEPWLEGAGSPEKVVPTESYPRPHPITPRDLWVDLPGGTFLMGSPEDEVERYPDEGPQHEVELSAFQMMRFPVTRELYREVMGNDPGWPMQGDDLAERPVNNVSFFDAATFCNQLSQQEGLEPVYFTRVDEVGPFADGDQIRWKRDADGYRLPTEAEWEYACRAGNSSRFCFGDLEEELGDYAWYFANEPQPVGCKKPNEWGLYDLHGNVWEWCWDHFAAYPAKKQVNPTGPVDRSALRPVVRGGSYWIGPGKLRSACRNEVEPVGRNGGLGFRCIRFSRPVFGPSAS